MTPNYMILLPIRFSVLLLKRRTWFVATFQSVLVIVSLLLAWLLRFDFSLPYPRIVVTAAIILPLIRLAVFSYFNLLHGWWRYSGVSDLLDISKAIILGTALFWLAMHIIPTAAGFPRTVFILEMVLSGLLLSAVRLFSRAVAESVRKDDAATKKVILIGAGFAAQMIIRELGHPLSGFRVLYCLDDNPTKLGIRINGVQVIGPVNQLPEIVAERMVDEVLIAVPSATGAQMQRFVEICNRANVRFRTVPTLKEIIAGQVTVNQLREVSLDDLLGRDPIEINLQSVRSTIQGRTVLVTGAAGSIGSELCRQILEHQPRMLVCLDRDESAMFYLNRDLSSRCDGSRLEWRVADVGDRREMEHIFREHRPEAIFHAAAYKHVPLMEANVSAAVQNNVFGLMNLLSVATDYDCKTFILISSDKAVNPRSVMGATKRICELIIAHRPTNGMRCLSVRFGNVLGSNGSLIPILQKQLRDNESLTITHPEMKRFFMSSGEAVSLVLQASVIGEKGDTLVLDMGDPVPIMQLVQTLIKLSGKDLDAVKIIYTGLRDGEKLLEELFYANERVGQTSFPKIKRARGQHRDWEMLASRLDELEATLFTNGSETVRGAISTIVPEYSSRNENEGPVQDQESLLATKRVVGI